MPHRIVAKIVWYPSEFYRRVGFIVIDLTRPAEWGIVFYNRRGACEQWIKDGKSAIKCTLPSYCSSVPNAVRLQLSALALSKTIAQWSRICLRERLAKIAAEVVRRARYTVLQRAEAVVPRELFGKFLRLIDGLRRRPASAWDQTGRMRRHHETSASEWREKEPNR